MYTLLKTNDQAILARRITGAEASIRIDVGGVVTSLDQVIVTVAILYFSNSYQEYE